MSQAKTYSESIIINASPQQVYDVVSDVTRTGQWSPTCKECWWVEGTGPVAGAKFKGRNESPRRTWETVSEVVAAEPGRVFSWSVGEGKVNWAYTLTAVPEGTELAESWEFTEAGQDFFKEKFGETAQFEMDERSQAAHEGIPATLQAIKRIVEAELKTEA